MNEGMRRERTGKDRRQEWEKKEDRTEAEREEVDETGRNSSKKHP